MRFVCGLMKAHIFVLGIMPKLTLMDSTKETSIQCSSDKDFTFRLHNNMLHTSITIAECDFAKKSCLMLTKTHKDKYNVSYTGRGGILIIRVLDKETIGTYQCHETFDPNNTVSTNISPSDFISTNENCSENLVEVSDAGETDTFGHIVLGTLKNASIECSSNVDLTFSFFSNTSQTPVTLAECDLAKKTCRMITTSSQNKYSLVYTGCGGVLHIESQDNDTIGDYSCFETFNPTNFISFDISFPYTDLVVDTTYNVTISTESNTERDRKETGIQNNMIFEGLVGIWVGCCCICIVCFLIRYWKKLKLCHAANTTKQAPKQRTESKRALISKESDTDQEQTGKETHKLLHSVDCKNDDEENQSEEGPFQTNTAEIEQPIDKLAVNYKKVIHEHTDLQHKGIGLDAKSGHAVYIRDKEKTNHPLKTFTDVW
ncbi:uncharacterized protein LOC127869256 isoform X2 [Dreissena polymorpha]|uniref:uncharacterized protein LOC127869256 isoform X2 n=1 Tax=Dreissena polymorpha TaxID=45954 RepID=UPI0022644339|nr:uncharacterized protein LOC127869256 isoform X2 [Dreissena polymorpha]